MAGRLRPSAPVCLLAALLGPAAPSSGQIAERTNWRFLTSADGLVESWTYDATRGPSGRLIISHGEVRELSVFDGYRIERLPAPGPYLTVREGPDGVLWAMLRQGGVGNFVYLGMQRLEGGRWVPYRFGDGAAAFETPVLASSAAFLPLDRDRVLVAGGGRLLDCRVKDGTLAVALPSLGRDTPAARLLVPAQRGGAWLATDRGIERIAPGADGALASSEVAAFPAGLGPVTPTALVDAGSAGLFVTVRARRAGRETDVLIRAARGWRELFAVPARAGRQLTGWPGTDGQWWTAVVGDNWFELGAGTDDGAWQAMPRGRELAGRLLNVLPEPDGGFWLATSTGLARNVPTIWHTPRDLAAFTRPSSTIFESRRGDLYIQHDDELLQRREGRWRAVRFPSGRDGGLVRTDAMVELRDGRILVGGRPTEAAIFDPDGGTFAPLRHPRGRFVEVLGPARDGGAWVLTTDDGQRRYIEHFDGRVFVQKAAGSDRWSTLPPRSVVELSDGRWLVVPDGDGYGEGSGAAFRSIGPADGLPFSPIAALEVAPGRIWFGTRDEVYERAGGAWRLIRSGLQSVRSIVRTRDGTIWVASSSGVHRLKDGVWLSSDAAEGLPEGAVYDLFEDRAGDIWASTLVGIARLERAADREPPETWVDEANPREAPPSGDLRLTFRGMDRWQASPAGRLLYSWRTDAGPWSPFVPAPTASFTGLAAGVHRFEVRSMDRAGNVDPTPAAFAFTVLLPWYRAPGFLAVGVLSAISIAALAGLVVSRHRRLERLVADRTGALASANDRLREQLERERVVEAERARLEAQLNQSQKLEAVGRLAGGVAHDFNNLLSVIGSYSELMLDELPDEAPLRTPALEIAKASDRAASLTRQLLAFSRHQVVDARPLDLNDIVADVQRMLRRLIGENIELAVEPGPGLWRVHADRGQIEQVLFNLAANARDAMPQGGVLTIRTCNVEVDAAFVRAHVGATQGPHVQLEVTDTGVGMDAATARRVFEPFFTTKSAGMGSGLGLATVYGIVKRANGFISVDSAPGRGTAFVISLPRTDLPLAPPAARTLVTRPIGNEKILIIEDADPVRALAATVLRRSGYEVVDVPGGEAAELLFANTAFDVDLVLSDIVLKGMSGPQFAERLRRLRPATRVLFMSGYADDTVVQFGAVDVQNAFLQKPFTPESLASKVREILDAPAAN